MKTIINNCTTSTEHEDNNSEPLHQVNLPRKWSELSYAG